MLLTIFMSYSQGLFETLHKIFNIPMGLGPVQGDAPVRYAQFSHVLPTVPSLEWSSIVCTWAAWYAVSCNHFLQLGDDTC